MVVGNRGQQGRFLMESDMDIVVGSGCSKGLASMSESRSTRRRIISPPAEVEANVTVGNPLGGPARTNQADHGHSRKVGCPADNSTPTGHVGLPSGVPPPVRREASHPKRGPLPTRGGNRPGTPAPDFRDEPPETSGVSTVRCCEPVSGWIHPTVARRKLGHGPQVDRPAPARHHRSGTKLM